MTRVMRFILLCIFVSTGIVLAACSGTHTSSKILKLEKYRNKWVFINYWASWCESCQLEIPELDAFAKKYPQKVVFFGVNYDGLQGDPLKAAIAKSRITFTVLAKDPAAYLKLPTVTVVPTTFVFNPAGNLTATLLGPQSQMSLKKIIGK